MEQLEMGLILAIKIPNKISENSYNKLLEIVSQKRRANIERYSNLNDIYSSLLGSILVRFFMIKYFSLTNEEIKIKITKYNKPYQETIKNFYFNISHSGGWVVCAFDRQPIGIDIEKIKIIDYTNIGKLFHTKEYETLMCSSHPVNLFFKIWTQKESYIKANGKGLLIPLESFIVNCKDSNIFEIASKNSKKIYYTKSYKFENSFIISLCKENKKFENKIKKLELNELLRVFV